MSAPLKVAAADLRLASDEAIARLFATDRRRLLAVASRIVAPDEAEDVVQDAFVNALRKRDQFRGAARPSTWVHRITVNAALMRLRSKRRRPTSSIEDEEGHHAVERAQESPDAVELLDRAQLSAALRGALDAIAPLDRRIVSLRLVDGASTEDVARTVGISVAATKTRLCRARASLRGALAGATVAAATV